MSDPMTPPMTDERNQLSADMREFGHLTIPELVAEIRRLRAMEHRLEEWLLEMPSDTRIMGGDVWIGSRKVDGSAALAFAAELRNRMKESR